ncbi:MAG: hypothetical protein ACXVCY_12985 [Pseudobdellovibrionaceae bacterium]
MVDQKNKIPFSKKDKREISPFIGHELLYDYLTGSLDKERRVAVEDHVKFSREAQLDLGKIQSGQTYAEKLSGTVVSQPIITQITAPTTYLSVLMQKANFDKWPQGLKWGLEALVVVIVIVIVLTITPWQKVLQFRMGMGSKEVVLAEVEKTVGTSAVEEKPEFVDEGVKETAKDAAKGKSNGADKGPTKTVDPSLKDSDEPMPSTLQASTADSKNKKTADTSLQAAVTGGFLYRGTIAVTNIDVVGPKITEKIAELGGRKAGAVELGWQKIPGSMYYHFTIPEAKYQDLLNFLSTYGKAKIGKEKHSRVMPDGIVRLILTVDEAKK